MPEINKSSVNVEAPEAPPQTPNTSLPAKPTSKISGLKARLSRLPKRTKIIIVAAVVILLIAAGAGAYLYFNHRHDSGTESNTKNATSKNQKTTTKSSSGTSSSSGDSAQSSSSQPSGTTSSNGNSSSGTSGSSGSSSSSSSGSSSGSGSGSGSSVPPTPAAVLSVTGVTLGVNNSNVTAGCNQTFDFVFTGTITASAAGSMTYHWYKTDLGDSGPITLTFDAAGTKTVSTTWTFNGSTASYFDGTVRLETLTPNSISKLRPFHFASTCI
ncbi:MAG TPA: hypothetical protein VMR45_05055 [Patescibacteria group bacterium]|nr:hypothetical protein [Patescibacteria group bacterium]